MKPFLKISKLRNRTSRLRAQVFLSTLLLIGMSLASVTIDQPVSLARARSSLRVRFTPPPLPGRGTPGQRGQGASRGPCRPNEQPLTALVPTWETAIKRQRSEDIRVTNVWGLTTQAQPTVWFYVPKAINTSAEFVLQNEAGETLYRTRLVPPQQAGIVRVQLPSTAPPLEINKLYRWFFKVKSACNPNQFPQLNYVEGWVQRINPTVALSDRLKRATPEERLALFAENGIWFDAVTTLAELRISNPTDTSLAADWQTLLKAANLEALSTQAIVP